MKVLNVQDVPECFNIAIVVSHFNRDITEKLLDGAVLRLKELGFSEDQITAVWVPGAVEIPLTAQRLALTKKFAAVICLGAVIFGETKHFEYVCEQVSQGCQAVALSQNIPVIFGVLTTENLQQAQDRTGGKKGHMGREAADAAYHMVSVLKQIEG
jgi:6,7-dimethyl-8-ribityllumazine synthase